MENDEKQSLLVQIKSFLSSKETPKRMTRDEFIIQHNKEIDEAIKRVEASDFLTQEDLEKEAETW